MLDRHGLCERRACKLADFPQSVFQYTKQDQGDEALRKRRRFLPGTAIKTSWRAFAISIATKTGSVCAILVSVIVGLPCGVVVQNHCRDLRPGFDRPLRYLRAARAIKASKSTTFQRCYVLYAE